MNNSSSFALNANFIEIVSLTTAELWIQLIIFYGFLCGIVANSLNILIWVGILRTKSMRTRFFVIVAFLTFCRTGLCCQYLITAIYRSLRTLDFVSVNRNLLTCHFLHFWLIHGYTLELTLLGTLLLERTIAVVRPNSYFKISNYSVYRLCVAQCIVVSLVKLVPSYIEENLLGTVLCVNLYSFLKPNFNTFMQTTDFILVAVILLLYCLLISYVRWKSKKIEENIQANEAVKTLLERHQKLMPVLRTLILFHCGLTLVAKLLTFLSGVVGEKSSQRLVAFGGIFVCLDLFINAVALLATNREIREAAMPWSKKIRLSKVTPSNPNELMRNVFVQ